MSNSCHQQLEDERKRRTSTVQTLTISEHNLAEARKKLTVEEQARRSTDSALEGADVHEVYTIEYSHIYIFSLTFMLFYDLLYIIFVL